MSRIIDVGREVPYSDSGCVTKDIINNFWWDWEEWLWEFRIQLAGHSKNWCMGSLNIDILSIEISVGPAQWFWAYRLNVLPPHIRSKNAQSKNK